jgi:hypothetical protein
VTDLGKFPAYYNESRTHRSLGKNTPVFHPTIESLLNVILFDKAEIKTRDAGTSA